MNDNFTFLDLLRYGWSHLGKYIGISLCTVVLYFLGILIIDIFIPVSGNSLTGLMVTLAVTNCTGYLAGKLNRILALLEEKEDTDNV